jgi:transposase-like protein
MSSRKPLPKTLLEAVRYFSDIDLCTEYFASIRWPNGPVCPRCGSVEHSYLKTRRIWKCKACKRQFSVKVGTIFEDSPLGLDKWLPAVWLAANSKNGISSHELGRALGTTQKSAWFMLHRIRLAMQTGSFDKLSGIVEVDESFIGGKARNMHAHVRRQKIQGRGTAGKTVVMGFRERGGNVRAQVVADASRDTLQDTVRENVEREAIVFTDEHQGYSGLESDFYHATVNHAEKYVDGQVSTNGIENFWSLLKRGLHGTYAGVEPFHLFRYLDERVFTYNLRDLDDYGRFEAVLGAVTGRRLTYLDLTGR